MKTAETFRVWVSRQLEIGDEELERMHLDAAFEMLLSRFELARRRGSRDPVATGSTKRAGGNSRLCTKRMLEHLGYSPAERRAVQRLLAGTTSGWPGLLRLYAAGHHLSASDRQYAHRQVKVFTRQKPDCSNNES